MTPKQKMQHQQHLTTMIQAAGFTQDRYGNWLNTYNGQQYRIKFKLINIRIERKSGGRWISVKSVPVVSMPLDHMAAFLARFMSQPKPTQASPAKKSTTTKKSHPAQTRNQYAVTIRWITPDGRGLKSLYLVRAYSEELAEKWASDLLQKEHQITNYDMTLGIQHVDVMKISGNTKVAEISWTPKDNI